MHAADRVMAPVLVAQETAAGHRRARDPLPPGRRNTDFVVGAVTFRRWCSTIRTLALVRVGILIFRQFVGRVAGVEI